VRRKHARRRLRHRRDEQFLRAEWCEQITNFSGALPAALACLGDSRDDRLWTGPPARAAVDTLATPPRPGWEGFLRPERT
jgi:hypothetical protein